MDLEKVSTSKCIRFFFPQQARFTKRARGLPCLKWHLLPLRLDPSENSICTIPRSLAACHGLNKGRALCRSPFRCLSRWYLALFQQFSAILLAGLNFAKDANYCQRCTPRQGLFSSPERTIKAWAFRAKFTSAWRRWVVRVVATIISFLDVTIGVIPRGPVFRAHLHAMPNELVMKDHLSPITSMIPIAK